MHMSGRIFSVGSRRTYSRPMRYTPASSANNEASASFPRLVESPRWTGRSIPCRLNVCSHPTRLPSGHTTTTVRGSRSRTTSTAVRVFPAPSPAVQSAAPLVVRAMVLIAWYWSVVGVSRCTRYPPVLVVLVPSLVWHRTTPDAVLLVVVERFLKAFLPQRAGVAHADGVAEH